MHPVSEITELNVEPTNKCNLNCTICSDDKTRPQGNMSMETYEMIVMEYIKESPNGEIRLFLSGEPLLHPKLAEMIKFARMFGSKHILIHTNATLLNEENSKALIEAGLTDISFSVDGGTKEEYEKIRGNHFEEAVKGVQAFLKINNGKVKTILQCIVPYPSNPIVSYYFRELFKGIHKFYGRYPHSWAKKGSVSEALPLIRNKPCAFLFCNLGFYWNGDATICCACLNGEYILGNIQNHTIEELWNSDDMNYLRESQKQLLPVDEKYPCAHCERYGIWSKSLIG